MGPGSQQGRGSGRRVPGFLTARAGVPPLVTSFHAISRERLRPMPAPTAAAGHAQLIMAISIAEPANINTTRATKIDHRAVADNADCRGPQTGMTAIMPASDSNPTPDSTRTRNGETDG